jgi:DNA polymerase III epsilon subunit-like protein
MAHPVWRLPGKLIQPTMHLFKRLSQRCCRFGLRFSEFDYLSTYRVAERIWPDLPAHNLKALAAHIGHDFNHHHA